MSFEVSIAGLKYGQMIPDRYTCKGENISPEITWKEPPTSGKEIVIFLDDPDAPKGNFNHWIITNITPSLGKIHENVSKEERTSEGWYQLKNDFGQYGYGGPCPPGRSVHHYILTLYSIVKPLENREKLAKEQIRAICEETKVKKLTWMFTYGRK